ncbi:MAG TPA: rhodanese-like domain-containing protein, partial [Candidatus Deferrimicrobium sp.]|nr:rhodanese-like domain-containing protein [Candidatus Deferrimicrobium sp.]
PDVDRYVDAASARSWRLSATLDTHVHNDFLSGGPNLRAAAGSVFAVPDNSGILGADLLLNDGDEVAVGTLRLRAIHSPGHTPEHLSYLLVGSDGEALALFSGGALMVGTMARPDLLGPSWTFALSRMGRETLQHRLLTLPDELAVLPTHGGGSFCGSAASDARVTTIGTERRDNPLATATDLAHFLALHAKQGRYPAYYPRMAPLNRAAEAQPPFRATSQLTPTEFEAAVAQGAVAVDCRPLEAFDAGHVPGSLSVPCDGPFSAWVGWVIDIDQPVVLVADSARAADDASRQLARIGFHRRRGWLDAQAWIGEGRQTRSVTRCTMGDLAERILDGDHLTVIDVRQDNEWAAGHIPGAVHALAPDLPALVATLDRDAPVAVHCATGYRAALGVSMLLRDGVDNVWHVSDGVEAWTELGHPLVTSA